MFPFFSNWYNFDYNYNYDFSWFFNQPVTLWDGFTVTMFTLLCYSLSLLLWLICYVFQGIALYRMAKQHGIAAPVLAWVPVLNFYMLGKVADRVSADAYGKYTHKRVALPIFHAILTAGSYGLLAFIPAVIQFLVQFFAYYSYMPYPGGSFDYHPVTIAPYVSVLTTSLLLVTIAVLYYVFLLRAVYVMLKDRSPRNSGLFIVLCVFVSYAIGPCLFGVSKKPSYAAARAAFNRQQAEAYQQAQVVSNSAPEQPENGEQLHPQNEAPDVDVQP